VSGAKRRSYPFSNGVNLLRTLPDRGDSISCGHKDQSISGLGKPPGRRVEVRRLLADVYSECNEVFDTADLQEARELLDEPVRSQGGCLWDTTDDIFYKGAWTPQPLPGRGLASTHRGRLTSGRGVGPVPASLLLPMPGCRARQQGAPHTLAAGTPQPL
jgi:hypothetical protein